MFSYVGNFEFVRSEVSWLPIEDNRQLVVSTNDAEGMVGRRPTCDGMATETVSFATVV